MIPVKLTISGFLSYQEPTEIDFTGLHVACITGRNGAGKSAMLDAITWALFGEARKNDDSVVNDLVPDHAAKVDFEFIYEDALYQVRRQKAIGKPTTAEFFIRAADGNSWKPLTEKRVTDTNRRICGTLHMDYKTFINASFFLQGKADQFTGQNATERKKILSTILDLDVWEEYKARAVEKRKENERNVDYIKSLIQEAEGELQQENELNQKLGEIETRVAEAQKEADKADQKWSLAKSAEALLLSLRNTLEQKQRDEDRQSRQVRNLEMKLDARTRDLKNLQARMVNADEIEKNYSRLLVVREQLEQLNNDGMEYNRLISERTGLMAAIQNRENQLSFEHNQLTREKSELDRRLAEKQSLMPNYQRDLKQQKELANACSQLPELRDQLSDSTERGAQYKTRSEALVKQASEMELKIRKFRSQEGGVCPNCGRLMDAEHCKIHAAEMEKDLDQVRTEHTRIESIRDAEREVWKKLNAQVKQLEGMEKDLSGINVRVSGTGQKIRAIDELAENWDKEKKDRLGSVEQILSAGDFCQEERTKLTTVQSQLSALNYDAQVHAAVRTQNAQLSGAEKAHQDLVADQVRIEPLQRELDDLTKQLADEREHLGVLRTEREKADEVCRKQQARVPDIRAIEAERNAVNERLTRLHREEGSIKQLVSHLDQARENLRRYSSEYKEKCTLAERYKTLEKAFGKDGVPALLIEQAVPEIEEQANILLQQLSNGTMTLQLNTQGAYKKKKDEVKETLDILISDPYGVREYEMFSGGEAFRINFALRLALSRILAQRAGSRLQTLVIDEGFGSQDEEGRARLAEAITAVQYDFEKILVITHLSELKEAFPSRIEVEKTAGGSRAEVIL